MQCSHLITAESACRTQSYPICKTILSSRERTCMYKTTKVIKQYFLFWKNLCIQNYQRCKTIFPLLIEVKYELITKVAKQNLFLFWKNLYICDLETIKAAKQSFPLLKEYVYKTTKVTTKSFPPLTENTDNIYLLMIKKNLI